MKALYVICISTLSISVFTFVQYPTASHFGYIVMLFSCIMALQHFMRYVDEQKQRTAKTFQIYEQSEMGKQYHALPSASYVYIIQDIDVTGYCKIGMTGTLYKRIHDIGVKIPFRVQVVHVIPCQNMSRAETILHHIFAKKRIDGEWFNLDIIDIEYLKTLKSDVQ